MDELLSMIRTLKQLGTQVLQLQGGEPLLRDDLLVLINEAHSFGMLCDMVTNGILIEKKAEVVRRLDRICISLDGPPDTNDRNRGKGTYVSILKGIKFSRACGLEVRISVVLTAETTTEDIDWLVAFAVEEGVILNFSPSFEFTAQFGTHRGPHLIANEHLRMLFQHIIEHKKRKAPIQFSVRSYRIATHWPFTYQKRLAYSHELPLDFVHPKCYHGDYVVFIDSDGSVYPCCNFWGRVQWNIHKHGLKESIAGLSRDGCQACYIPSYIDRNLFFNGDPSVWWNYIAQNVKEEK
jgi:MoaA/NifB/PqqE/SkfB family radical SAM enzyme